MGSGVDIDGIRTPKGKALPVTTMNPHPAAKVPADAHLYSEKVAETSITGGFSKELTLTKGTKWTVLQVEVWRSGNPTNADNIKVIRGVINVGEHYNVIALTGAEDGNAHSTDALYINGTFTDTVGIWVTYWYS